MFTQKYYHVSSSSRLALHDAAPFSTLVSVLNSEELVAVLSLLIISFQKRTINALERRRDYLQTLDRQEEAFQHGRTYRL